MHVFKVKRLQITATLIILFLIFSSVIVTRVLTSHAAGGSVSLQAGETAVTGEMTNYSGNDGGSGGVFPPSTAINWPANAGYPTVHNSVGGTGTFADPITVAINSKDSSSGSVPNSSDYQIGEKFYIPQLHLYFVAEDSCNVDIDYADCTNNGNWQDNSKELHMDLFNGNVTDPSLFTNQQNCETSYGGNTPVIANAGPGYPMPDQYPQGTSLFVAPNDCVGATLWNQYNGWTIGTGTMMPTASPVNTTSTSTTSAANTLDVDDSVTGSGQNQFNYSGSGWKSCQNCDYNSVGFYNNSNSWGNTAGDSVTVAFTGTQIKFYGVVGPDHGIGQVSIDGGTTKQIDSYAPTEAGNTLLYTSPTLTAGQHTFKLTVTGQQNAASSDAYVNPDRVEITANATTSHTTTSHTTTTSSLSSNSSATTGSSKNALDSTASDSNWKMIWNDDFTGPTIDTSKWTVRDYPAGQFNNEQECYQDDGTHTRIDGTGANSHLVLEADKQINNSSCPYISGRLDTQGKYAVQPPTSGKPVRIEARHPTPCGRSWHLACFLDVRAEY